MAKGGTKYQKLREIDEYVSHVFRDARNHNEIIHDFDLINAALRKGHEMRFDQFKVSFANII